MDRLTEIESRMKAATGGDAMLRHCNTCIRDDGGTCHHPGLDASEEVDLCLESNGFPYWTAGGERGDVAYLLERARAWRPIPAMVKAILGGA